MNKPTDITVERFVKENLPDYEERFKMWTRKRWNDKSSFIIYHFPEALQSYTDRICREQREICESAYHGCVEQFDLSYSASTGRSILNAPMPEIKNE